MDKGAWRVCLFLLLAAAVAVGLCLLPRMTVGGYVVKRVQLPWQHGRHVAAAETVAETAAETEEMAETAADVAAADSLGRDSLRPVAAFVDTVVPPPDLVLIEDFGADSLGGGMEPFYRALSRRASLGRPVRIAFFGDSFVEGDILTGDLRELLQAAYGGGGVGYVDIVSPVAQFRATVRQSQHDWTSHSILDKSSSARALSGISGRSATSAQAGAAATFTPAAPFPHLSAATQATLYVCASDTQEVMVVLGGDTLSYALGGSGVQALRLPRVGKTTVVAPQAGLTAYGLVWEADGGISLDNFSLRGCAGLPLTSIPAQRLRQFAQLRAYDLIVLQFGLNIAERDRLDYSAYVGQMARVVAHLRGAYPQAGILIVSVGDRADRIDGELQTLPGVEALVRAQRRLAQQTGAAYWNLFAAMGGELGIARMAEAGEAAKDYTHLNARGGRRLAGALFRALEFGLGQYERKAEFHYNDEE